MDDKWPLKFEKDLTSFEFYNQTLPSLHHFFNERPSGEILFDFSGIDFINPLVVPNILACAVILKEYFKEPVELFIPWKPKLLSYLHDIKFLEISRTHKLFYLDEKYIGGFKIDSIDKECKTHAFDYGTSLEKIYYELEKSKKIIEFIFKDKFSAKAEKFDNLMEILCEIIQNGCSHSKSMCFATFQTNLGRNVKYKKAFLSVSDCGIGFYKSIYNKINKGEYSAKFVTNDVFLGLDDKKERDILSILEAIFFRQHENIDGLYDVITRILNQNGVVRIHSNTTQLILTKSNFEEFLKDKKLIFEYFNRKFEELINNKLQIKYSPVRKNEANFRGVHIELEVPLLDGGLA